VTQGRTAARPTSSLLGRVAVALTGAFALLASPGPARAYDPATTHAGLTERSIMASTLNKVLSERLGRPLGLFEPLRLRQSDLTHAEARSLSGRLGALDPANGYRPADDGTASALAWVVAGSVIAGTPAERGKNLFYDPVRGTGLGGAGDGAAFSHALRSLFDDGKVRALATGTDFNLTGLPATEWLASEDNDVGLAELTRGLEAAVAAPEPAARNTALARALLALGGTLAVLQDAGEPAHVRNDFVGSYLASGGENPFDRASAFERFVAERYGSAGLPPAAAAVTRPTLMAFITGEDHQGLADRTQGRFFSSGTLPEDAIVDRDTTTAEVMRDARGSLAYGLPRLPRLELASLGERRYAYAGPRRLLAYERVPGRVRFFLDDAVYADTARVLMPEIAAYGAGLVDHLFRVGLEIAVKDGVVSVEAKGARGSLEGRVRVFAEDARGRRTELGAGAVVTSDGASRVTVAVAPPSGTRRLAAVLRGRDAAGEVIAIAESDSALAPPQAPPAQAPAGAKPLPGLAPPPR
jgi:hypothetical protein